MKIGTLVRLGKDTGWSVEHHGIGIVIDENNEQRVPMRLVSFPKLGETQWRAIQLLEIVI